MYDESLSTLHYQILLVQGFVFGIGTGGVFTGALVYVAQWFIQRRDLAAGEAATGSSVGRVVFPIFSGRTKSHVGFHRAMRYAAPLMWVGLTLSLSSIRARLPREKWNPNLKRFNTSITRRRQFSL